MTDTATDAAVQAQFVYPVKIEDVAPATKKVSVEIPAERIAAKLSENLDELQSKAALPGFRVGHAPQKLIEKRFGADLREDVTRQLLSESYQQAIESNKLDVVGEPEFDSADKIKLPESGPLNYSFQVEIRPSFELPELKGIAIKKPKVELTEEHLSQAMKNLCEQQGTLVPVEDGGLQAKDRVTADFVFKLDGNELNAQKNAQFILQPARIAGIFIEDIDQQLAGLKPGESKTLSVKAPADHPREEIRDKDITIEVTISDIKRLEPAEINQDFLESLGFENEQELRDALKEQLEIRVHNDVQQAMRDQVVKFLMEKIQMELPSKMSARQESRIVQRRASDLLMRGMPVAEIEASIEKIKAGAGEQAAAELKSFFVLDKIAEQYDIQVGEAELNEIIATTAMQTGERPEKLKQRLAKDGTLTNIYLRLRENKAIDKILEDAAIEDVDVKDEQEKK